MFRRYGVACCAAAAMSGSAKAEGGQRERGEPAAPGPASSGSHGERQRLTPETQRGLRTFYRKLLEVGEDGPMMQHTLRTHTLPEALEYGKQMLSYHRNLLAVRVEQVQTPLYRHPLRRVQLAALRRKYAWSIFWLRIKLRSKNAISDALVYTLFIITCVLLYEIYRACRVGVSRAEERYRTMAVPILQTFDALEAMEARKKLLKKEIEDDILRERARA